MPGPGGSRIALLVYRSAAVVKAPALRRDLAEAAHELAAQRSTSVRCGGSAACAAVQAILPAGGRYRAGSWAEIGLRLVLARVEAFCGRRLRRQIAGHDRAARRRNASAFCVEQHGQHCVAVGNGVRADAEGVVLAGILLVLRSRGRDAQPRPARRDGNCEARSTGSWSPPTVCGDRTPASMARTMPRAAMAFRPQSTFVARGRSGSGRNALRAKATQPPACSSFWARVAASVAPPAMVTRLSDMRWMPRPKSWACFDGERAGVDAHPGDLRGQPAVFDLGAAVHHHLEAVVLGERRGLVVAHAELHPDHLRARLERERLLRRSPSAYCEARKMSTMSTGSGMSASLA